MKTMFLLSAAALSVLAQWPLLSGTDDANRTQPFTAAPKVVIQILDE